MPAGRPSAPAALKLLKGRREGQDSGGRKVKMPPPFSRLAPVKPAWLSAEAAEHWDMLVAEMTRPGLELLKPIDEGSLAIMCETYARWRAAQESVKRLGLTVETSQGIGKNPAVSIAETAARDYRAWATQFGLTPASEASLKEMDSGKDDDENPFAH